MINYALCKIFYNWNFILLYKFILVFKNHIKNFPQCLLLFCWLITSFGATFCKIKGSHFCINCCIAIIVWIFWKKKFFYINFKAANIFFLPMHVFNLKFDLPQNASAFSRIITWHNKSGFVLSIFEQHIDKVWRIGEGISLPSLVALQCSSTISKNLCFLLKDYEVYLLTRTPCWVKVLFTKTKFCR